MPISGRPIEATIQPYTVYGELVWGLYDIGEQVSRLYSLRTLVPSVSADVFSTWGYTARISMGRPPLSQQSALVQSNVKSNTTFARRTVIESRTDDSGDVISIDDRELLVSFQLHRHPLTDGQILTVFLKSMTFCSEHHEWDFGVSLTAFSEDQAVRLHMESEQPMSSADQLSWERARFALRALWMQVFMGFDPRRGEFVKTPRFESMSYVVSYQGHVIGKGWIG
ncbi:MAG: hypothetical protein Q9191_003005 [Dirinaria sp. TL-2023a]